MRLVMADGLIEQEIAFGVVLREAIQATLVLKMVQAWCRHDRGICDCLGIPGKAGKG